MYVHSNRRARCRPSPHDRTGGQGEQEAGEGTAETILAAAWDRPATRGWFSAALWQALDSYWGVDRME